jgi:hypothetical protein
MRLNKMFKYVVFVQDLDPITNRVGVVDIYGPHSSWDAAYKLVKKLRKLYPATMYWVGIRELQREIPIEKS